MASALTPIAWQSLSSATATVTFSSIPGTYRDLRVVIQGLGPAGGAQAILRFNGDTASNYSQVDAVGTGSVTGSNTNSGTSILHTIAASENSTNYSLYTADVLDYSATDKHKTLLSRWGRADTAVEMDAARWASTAAVTSVSFTIYGATWSAGSIFALYGVSA